MVTKIRLYDLIIQSANNYLRLQNSDGSFNPGHNGPWWNKDSPIRNTSHIALLLYKAHKLTRDKKYLVSAMKACEFIMLDKNRPYNFNFYCRAEADKVNGLIGVSWALEPLITIGIEMKITKYLNFSKKIIEMHNYNRKKHLWHVNNLDGKKGIICNSINQQIWFASMVLTLGNYLKDKSLIYIANDFFVNLPKKLIYLKGGIVSQTIDKNKIKNLLFYLLEEVIRGNKKCNYERSVGYQPFLMYGLCLAYLKNKELDLWKNEKIIGMIRGILVSLKNNYSPQMLPTQNRFIGKYNPIGFEIALILQTFGDLYSSNPNVKKDFTTQIKRWAEFQVKNYFNFDEGFMNKNTNDKLVLSARLYESIYLNNYSITLN